MVNRTPTNEQMASLWHAVADYINEQQLACAEQIYQSDNILLSAPELVSICTDKVGYFEFAQGK